MSAVSLLLPVSAVLVTGCPADPDGDAAGRAGGSDDRQGASVSRVPGQVVGADTAAISPDGASLVSGCLDDLCVWDTRDGSLRARWQGGSLAAWSPTDDLLATDLPRGSDGRAGVALLSARDGSLVRELAGHQLPPPDDDQVGGGLTALAFSPDGRLLASAGPDRAVRLWTVESGDAAGVLDIGSGSPDQLAFTPDGRRLAVAGPDTAVEVWDVEAGTLVATLDGGPQETVAFSPDGELLATTPSDPGATDTVQVRDTATWQTARSHARPLSGYRVAFSPDGSRLAITQSTHSEVLVWPVTGGPATRLTGHGEPPRMVLWAPDGGAVYTVGGRDGVLAWEPGSGRLLKRFELPAPAERAG